MPLQVSSHHRTEHLAQLVWDSASSEEKLSRLGTIIRDRAKLEENSSSSSHLYSAMQKKMFHAWLVSPERKAHFVDDMLQLARKPGEFL